MAERGSISDSLKDEQDDINLDDFTNNTVNKTVDKDAIRAAAEKHGFGGGKTAPKEEVSAEKRSRRRRAASPYTVQVGARARPEIKEIFQEVNDLLGIYDNASFEQAVLAFCEKNSEKFDLSDQINRINSILGK